MFIIIKIDIDAFHRKLVGIFRSYAALCRKVLAAGWFLNDISQYFLMFSCKSKPHEISQEKFIKTKRLKS